MSDTPISKLLANARRPLLSFEFFPPKSDADMDSLKHSATQLLTTEPDFVTCTYGAGGSTRKWRRLSTTRPAIGEGMSGSSQT